MASFLGTLRSEGRGHSLLQILRVPRLLRVRFLLRHSLVQCCVERLLDLLACCFRHCGWMSDLWAGARALGNQFPADFVDQQWPWPVVWGRCGAGIFHNRVPLPYGGLAGQIGIGGFSGGYSRLWQPSAPSRSLVNLIRNGFLVHRQGVSQCFNGSVSVRARGRHFDMPTFPKTEHKHIH